MKDKKKHANHAREWYRRNRDKARQWKRSNPERVREYRRRYRDKIRASEGYREIAAVEKRQSRARALRREYGLTPEAVEALRQVQNNRCRICGDSFENVKMNVDHDHSTGRVRGLLCANCNRGLGMFRDSIERLASAMHYLNQ